MQIQEESRQRRVDYLTIDKYKVTLIYLGEELTGAVIEGPRIKRVYIPKRAPFRVDKLPKKVKKYLNRKLGFQII